MYQAKLKNVLGQDFDIFEWLCAQTTLEEKDSGNTVAAVNCYFMSQDGSMFKAQVPFSPYFYLQIKVRPLLLQPHRVPGKGFVQARRGSNHAPESAMELSTTCNQT